ncbi:MAG: hypothetical protein R3D29_02400 [Nitratireductor sp.]
MDAQRLPDGPAIRDGKPYSQIVHLAEDVTPFVAISRLLEASGYAPSCIPLKVLAKAAFLGIATLFRSSLYAPLSSPKHANVFLLGSIVRSTISIQSTGR